MIETIHRQQIVAARAALYWNQRDLAEAANIGLATLKKYENGHTTPNPKTLAAIVRALEDAGIEFHNDGATVSVSYAR